MFSLPLIGGIFTADTLIKRKIEQAGEAELPKSFARGKVTICRSHNKGMMMNTGDKKPAMVKGITSLGFAGLIAWYLLSLRPSGGPLKLGGALMIGGASSNVCDHLTRGYVVDYLKFALKPLRNVVFNISDFCIFIGSFLILIGAFFSAWFLHLLLQPLDLMIHQKQYGVSHYLRQMDNFTIFGPNKRKLRRLLEDVRAWLAEVGLRLKGNWQIFRVGFTPRVEKAHDALSEKKQRHRRPRIPSALGYRFGHGYTILRKHNLFRLKRALHTYYHRRDRNRVISFKRASGLISRLGQLRKCNSQRILERYYQPNTMFNLKKVVRRECRRLQRLYPPYRAA